MRTREFLQHLRRQGCRLHRHGANHDIWLNPAVLAEAAVPRHRDLAPGTARAICKQLQVPLPTFR